MKTPTKISIIGAGYVGMSLALVLSRSHYVTILDINQDRVNAINNRESFFKDEKIEIFLQNQSINLQAVSSQNKSFRKSELFLICTPTDFDANTQSFNTKDIEQIVKDIFSFSKDALIVIKSTIPIGFIDKLQDRYNTGNIFYSPEFLREGSALNDNLKPSRIVIGSKSKKAKLFGLLMMQAANIDDVPIFYTDPNEAEAIKLFANTYLAMRVAFFNELDSLSMQKDLDVETIINGISADSRIGDYYNNPSFGYGGYCLPKDSKQLLSSFNETNTPQSLIEATVKSNEIRKKFIAEMIVKGRPKKVGIYRLLMKANSDNTRSAAILDIISLISKKGVEIIIYEPSLTNATWDSFKVEKNLEKFKKQSDLILSNRVDGSLKDIQKKVFTRDIFNIN